MRLSLSCVALLPGAIAWSCEDSGVSLTLTDLPAPAPVCNDGTPAQYFFLPASSGKADETLIYLSGGGQCSDEASCAARFDGSGYPFHDCTNSTEASPCFMSDKDFPVTCTKGGVLEMMAQRNANVVYVPYCSSDGWMGDKKFGDFEMRGAAIALAVVDALKPVVGGGGKVVFGGGSAGGRGAAVLLDAVAERLEGVAEVVGFLDSPYYSDATPEDADFEGFAAQTEDVYRNFVNGGDSYTAVAGEACTSAYPGETWKCLFGEFRFPFIATQYLLVADQFDGWQLSHNVHDYDGIESDPVYTEAELEAVGVFAKQQHALLETLPGGKGAGGSMVHATACYSHHISETDAFYTVKNGKGVSQADALGGLLGGEGGGGGGGDR